MDGGVDQVPPSVVHTWQVQCRVIRREQRKLREVRGECVGSVLSSSYYTGREFQNGDVRVILHT